MEDKLKAIRKEYDDDTIELNTSSNPTTFEYNGAVYSIRSWGEYEADARQDIENIFVDCYDTKSLTAWIEEHGSYEDFYNEEYIEDFRYNDDTFYDMSHNEIINWLRDCGYLNEITLEMLDMKKLVDFVWGVDEGLCLSMYDGEIKYIGDFVVIREE